MKLRKHFVITIAGTAGSGKSTLSREEYIKIDNQVRKNVDLIVDGMSSIEKITQEIIQKINKHRKEMPNKK